MSGVTQGADIGLLSFTSHTWIMTAIGPQQPLVTLPPSSEFFFSNNRGYFVSGGKDVASSFAFKL